MDDATIGALVSKLDRGELLDSQRSSSEPVSSALVDDGTATRYTYQDGSVRVLSVTQAQKSGSSGGISPLAVNTISGCKNESASNIAIYTGCLIKFDDGITVLKFKSSYSRWSGGANVSDWNSPQAATAYGSVTSPKFTFTRRNYSSGAGPATVQMHTKFTSWNGLSSEDMYLSLKVTPSKATIDNY
ncbi:hypothetical protein [Microbacterium luticocti]|uniref:hypothetical protein n=1 Tax=Microbacterium luticocti TaxID=451764 RepID=UPI00048B791F|nr:hypothetical protein [Microbacterium luticocti]